MLDVGVSREDRGAETTQAPDQVFGSERALRCAGRAGAALAERAELQQEKIGGALYRADLIAI